MHLPKLFCSSHLLEISNLDNDALNAYNTFRLMAEDAIPARLEEEAQQ
jgi:hypothetical protein